MLVAAILMDISINIIIYTRLIATMTDFISQQWYKYILISGLAMIYVRDHYKVKSFGHKVPPSSSE